MTSALVSSSNGPGAPALAADLDAAGVTVLAKFDYHDIVQGVVHNAPDLVVIYEANPGADLFAGAAAVKAVAPRPVIVFTTDPDAKK